MNNRSIKNLKPITLPKPLFNCCASIFEALKMRTTCRTISGKMVSLQLLSDILWAAQGVNSPQGPFGSPGKTAGSASNSKEICVYVATAEGTYLYEPEIHEITPISAGDIRNLAISPGQWRAGANAPIRFIYVVDTDRFKNAGFQEPGLYNLGIEKSYYFVDTGLIAQNVYLATSAFGLASWFHNCNKDEIAKALRLKSYQRALFGQTIGYPED